MQKALTQMNVKLQQVIRVTGKTGMDIIEAIAGGERDPRKLARLHQGQRGDHRQVAAGALARRIFELTQALELYRFYQDKIAQCDREIDISS